MSSNTDDLAMPMSDAAHLARWAAPVFTAWRERGTMMVMLDRWADDPMMAPDAPRSSGQDDAGREGESVRPAILPLTHEPVFGDQPERSPALMVLDYATPGHLAWMQWSLLQAHAQFAAVPYRPALCVWLTPARDEPFAAMFEREHWQVLQRALSQRLRCVLHANGDGYLRYFDPRVLPRLCQILGPQVANLLLTPVSDWYQLDRTGTWLNINSAWCSALPAPGYGQEVRWSTAGNCLQFGAEATLALNRVHNLSRAAQALAEQSVVVPHAHNERLDQALLTAQAHGLTDDADCVCFALHAILHGAAFTAHPELQSWCQAAAQAGMPLAQVIEQQAFATDALGR